MDLPDGGSNGLVPIELSLESVPAPDAAVEPDGFVVLVGAQDRIHFLDWGGPASGGTVSQPGSAPGALPPDAPPPGAPRSEAPGVLLIHGYATTAWSWAPVARRLRRGRHTVAMDLRGHGLSDAPVEGYDAATLAEDVVAVAEGSGLVAEARTGLLTESASAPGPGQGGPGAGDRPPDRRVVLAGHGFGAAVATWGAIALGRRCAGLVLVDGGWEDLRATTGLEPEEYLREDEEPPEVLRSMRAYLADRRGFDPGSWDADQERAARASVVELPAGRVEPAIHPHVRTAMVGAMFDHRPGESLAAVEAPILVLVAGGDESRMLALEAVASSLLAVRWSPIRVARLPAVGHNLMRYRPAEVAAAILAIAPESS